MNPNNIENLNAKNEILRISQFAILNLFDEISSTEKCLQLFTKHSKHIELTYDKQLTRLAYILSMHNCEDEIKHMSLIMHLSLNNPIEKTDHIWLLNYYYKIVNSDVVLSENKSWILNYVVI